MVIYSPTSATFQVTVSELQGGIPSLTWDVTNPTTVYEDSFHNYTGHLSAGGAYVVGVGITVTYTDVGFSGEQAVGTFQTDSGGKFTVPNFAFPNPGSATQCTLIARSPAFNIP